MIRRALLSMSSSPESFFILRRNFLASLSVMNIATWLLGIGDRHLLNLLMNRRTGKITGIDFERCFGSATRDLSVPELIPFRLTPQLVSVNNPLGTAGLIKTCMTQSLRTFERDRNVMLAYLEVFIREPLTDWSKTSDSSRAERQIAEVLQKVNGVNPVQIFENNLRNGYFFVYAYNPLPSFICLLNMIQFQTQNAQICRRLCEGSARR